MQTTRNYDWKPSGHTFRCINKEEKLIPLMIEEEERNENRKWFQLSVKDDVLSEGKIVNNE